MRFEDHGSVPPERGLAIEIDALRALARASARRPLAPRRQPPVPTEPVGPTASRPQDARLGAQDAERLLVWESTRPAVVLPRLGNPQRWVHATACAALDIPLLHRVSGGGAVVVGPGCLSFALVLSLGARPRLADVARSYDWLLAREAGALALGGVVVRSTDLALRDRKFAGHAQRRVGGALLHHGVLLYDFDLDLIGRLLAEPPRAPAWRRSRNHREFLTNVPLSRSAIVRRLQHLPAALQR